MKKLLLLLNSRSVALWLLLLLALFLALSALLPSPLTTAEPEWSALARQRPMLHWLALHCSTPALVRSPFFLLVAMLLFLSTLVCTVQRLLGWWRRRESEFSREKAFSFDIAGAAPAPPAVVRARADALLRRQGWTVAEGALAGTALAAQRGIALSFWGSLVFHLGLLVCFAAVPVTVLTSVSGDLILTEGVTLPLREAVATARPERLPAAQVGLEELRGVYAEGRYKVDFGGTLVLQLGERTERFPFRVNQPAFVDGFQFSLQRFGFAPQVRVTSSDGTLFDVYANLRHGQEGDYFPLAGSNARLLLVLLPDFYQEGSAVGSRSREPRNPKLLFKVLQGETVIAKGMAGLGETVAAAGYRVAFVDLKNWAALTVSREKGLGLVIAGFGVVTAGLLLRFLSNERTLELELAGMEAGSTTFRLRGFSRYYPAFLEREVRELGAALGAVGEVNG
jgi:cytochrome c biogenesis protein